MNASRVDVARAREMREAGHTLKEIGDHFGVTRERIRQLVGSPPREKRCERCDSTFTTGRANQRYCSRACTVAANRETTCACGSVMSAQSTMCWDCTRTAQVAARDARRRLIADLWSEGLPMSELASRAGFANANALGVEMARMKNTGWDIQPRRAGWAGHAHPTGLPALPPETPEQARAQFQRAVQNGHIRVPEKCERCGHAGFLEGHHSDYSKPLYVEWLCRSCHAAHHAAGRRLERTA